MDTHGLPWIKVHMNTPFLLERSTCLEDYAKNIKIHDIHDFDQFVHKFLSCNSLKPPSNYLNHTIQSK